MPALYLSEIIDPKLLTLPKYAIGDRVRVTKITLTKNDAEDTKAAFLAALGQEFTIEEIELWETDDPENPYYVTYEFDVSHLMKSPGEKDYEFIYLTATELELVEKEGEDAHRPDA